MVAAALRFQIRIKFRLIKRGVGGKLDGIFIAVKFKEIHLVQLPCGIQSMGFQGRLIQLLHLRVEAIVLKHAVFTVGEVFDIEVDELGTQPHHLVDFLNKVVCHFVAEPQPLAHVLIEGNGALAAPAALVFLELYFVVFLSIPTGGLATDLHCGVGCLYRITQLAGQRAVLIPHLQKGIDLIAWHTHGLIIVNRIMVDLRPAVVGVLAVIAPAHGQVHCHHAAVIVDRVKFRIIPQVDTVDILQRSLFHLVSCFIPRRCL